MGWAAPPAAGMVKDLAARIVGRDPSRIEELWSELYDHSFWAKGGGAIVFAGISAIEQALWDIKGKSLGVPVYELLGGRMRDTVPVYANGWYGAASTPAELAKAAERPLRDGYKALEMLPARDLGRRRPAPCHPSAGGPRLRQPRVREGQDAARGGRMGDRDHARPLGRPHHGRDHPPLPALRGARHRLDRGAGRPLRCRRAQENLRAASRSRSRSASASTRATASAGSSSRMRPTSSSRTSAIPEA